MNHDLHVEMEAYPYLVAQRGALDDMRDNSMLWMSKYAEMLFAEFDRLQLFLPQACESILDVGSGLGGIDALINRHYGGECRVTLCDGVNDPPHMVLHRKTFNSMSVARRFLESNGVKYFSYIDANDPKRRAGIRYDLIVSQQSWCFHTPPNEHLDLVLSACHQYTTLIVDFRLDRPEWLYQMGQYFEHEKIHAGRKALTLAMWPNENFQGVLSR